MEILNGTFDTKYGRLQCEFRAKFRQMNEKNYETRLILCFQSMIMVFGEQSLNKGWLNWEVPNLKEQLQLVCAISINANTVVTKDDAKMKVSLNGKNTPVNFLSKLTQIQIFIVDNQSSVSRWWWRYSRGKLQKLAFESEIFVLQENKVLNNFFVWLSILIKQE